jgi:hypothetical protein
MYLILIANKTKKQKNYTDERPPLVGEFIANFSG